MNKETKTKVPKHRGPGGPGGPMSIMGEKPKDFKGTLKKLLSYIKEYKLGIILVIILSIGSALFAIRGPKIIGEATTEIYKGIMGKIMGNATGIDFDAIFKIVIILIVLYLASAIFSFLQSYIMAGISHKISYNLRRQISEKINRVPLKYFESRTTGEILSRVTNDVDTMSQNLSQSLTQVISSIVMLVGVTVMMFSISPTMTFASILIFPLGMGLIILIVFRSQKYFKVQQEYLGHINGQVEETYGGHDIVKTFNAEEKVVKEFDELNDTLYKSAWKSQFLSGMMMPIMTFIGNMGYVLVSILGGYLTIKNKIQIGDILSFTQYIRQFNQPIAQIAQITNLLQSTLAASERVFEFLDEKEEEKTFKDALKTDNLDGNIEFKNVSFGYDEDKIIIKDFNAKVKKGQKIAIVGPTGAGKTTMVKLLMRFYDVNSGEILIDGHNIKDFDRHELRDMFGMVLQDTWLFNGTIRENIRYGKLAATNLDVEQAADNSYVDHFIRTLPDSYNMVIDEEASNISQGQKQLLTIARVILKDPKILILDEATSSVDTRTEVLIQKAMDKLMKGRTSFVIAHRLSTIRNADSILVMRDGDIVEQGNHETLIKKKGFYAELYNSQFEDGEY